MYSILAYIHSSSRTQRSYVTWDKRAARRNLSSSPESGRHNWCCPLTNDSTLPPTLAFRYVCRQHEWKTGNSDSCAHKHLPGRNDKAYNKHWSRRFSAISVGHEFWANNAAKWEQTACKCVAAAKIQEWAFAETTRPLMNQLSVWHAVSRYTDAMSQYCHLWILQIPR